MRPGPLSAGMPQQYARRKNGLEEPTPLLRGMDEILERTYGLIIYQEACMNIGIKAFGFNSNQADSILRKTIAKKKKDKMEMLRRIMKYGKRNSSGPENWKDDPDLPWYDEKQEYGPEIDGGLKRGYSEKEMDDFWNTIQGFADYLFNLSHAACYSLISVATAYLKKYYPTEFFASVLSLQDTEEKIKKYIEVCDQYNIEVIVPDINISEEGFTPNAKSKKIYYGLASVKGIGEAVVPEIIKNRPYTSLQDVFDKLPKKVFNKRVALALAKCGALDSFSEDKDRCKIVDEIMAIRKEKNYEEYPKFYYSPEICMKFEIETLSAPVTYKPWWNKVKNGEIISETAKIRTVREITDKNGNLMAFVTLNINSCLIESVVFASVYTKSIGLFDKNLNEDGRILVEGKKEDDKLIVKRILAAKSEIDESRDFLMDII